MDEIEVRPTFAKFEIEAGAGWRVIAWHATSGQLVQGGDVLCEVDCGGKIERLRIDDGSEMIVGSINASAGAPLSAGDLLMTLWGITLEAESTEAEERLFDAQHGPTAGPMH